MKFFLLLALIINSNVYSCISIVNNCDNWISITAHISTFDYKLSHKTYKKFNINKHKNYAFSINPKNENFITFIRYKNTICSGISVFNLADFDLTKFHVQFIINSTEITPKLEKLY